MWIARNQFRFIVFPRIKQLIENLVSQVNTYMTKGQFIGPLVTSASFAVGRSV